MSWNLFNRQAKRSIVTKAEERDFERECAKIQHLEETSKKINKEAKKLVTAVQVQSKAAGKLGCDIASDLGDSAPGSLQEFESCMNKQAILSVDKANMIQHSLVGPMKEYNTIFPNCALHIKAREKSLQEYNKLQAKLEKYEEREHTAANSVKIEMAKKEVNPVKEDFEGKNKILMKELPDLYSLRLAYIQPSFEALLTSQCWFHEESLKSLEKCSKEMKTDTDTKEDATVKQILDDIKLLTITTDD